MKFSNFEITKTIGSSPLDWVYFGEVDVTTGIFFKKMVRKKVFREFGNLWCFSDTGSPTPSFYLENIERAYKVNERLESGK
jgi:hypothetical protein